MDNFVGSGMFKLIKSDERVTEDLDYCLYCNVSQSGTSDNSHRHKEIDYKIPLNCINGHDVKQCPACKTIYILRDPTQ